jgi:hypothetical protein
MRYSITRVGVEYLMHDASTKARTWLMSHDRDAEVQHLLDVLTDNLVYDIERQLRAAGIEVEIEVGTTNRIPVEYLEVLDDDHPIWDQVCDDLWHALTARIESA